MFCYKARTDALMCFFGFQYLPVALGPVFQKYLQKVLPAILDGAFLVLPYFESSRLVVVMQGGILNNDATI